MIAVSGVFFSVALLLFPLSSSAENSCSFAMPNALLQAPAYHSYLFRRAADNQALESGEISNGLHFEIRQSQCSDFIVRKFTLTLKPDARTSPVDFAIDKISDLKFSNPHDRPIGLLSFLKAGRQYKNSSSFSACKDGSSAPAGQCPWDSLGGYLFEVSHSGSEMTISVADYTSS